jgi:hypothetical protein
VDALVEGLGHAYLLEQDRWSATAAAVRKEIVRALSAGAPSNLESASQTLRYEIANRHHVGILAWNGSNSAADAQALQEAALSYLESTGGHQALLVRQGSSEVWALGQPPYGLHRLCCGVHAGGPHQARCRRARL